MKLNTSITFQVLESIQTPKLVRDYEKWEWKPHTTHSKSRIGGQLSTVNREVMGQEWTGMTSGKLRIGDFPRGGMCSHLVLSEARKQRVWWSDRPEQGLTQEAVALYPPPRESRGSPAASAGCLHGETECRSSPIRWEDWLKLQSPIFRLSSTHPSADSGGQGGSSGVIRWDAPVL